MTVPAWTCYGITNNGDVDRHGCDGIACRPATANAHGRQTSDTKPCVPCLNGDEFIGKTGCWPSPAPSWFLTHYPTPFPNAWACTLRCFNGGVCTKNYGSQKEYCACPPRYEGTQCEIGDWYKLTPPPSVELNTGTPPYYSGIDSSDCTFYASDSSGRLSSFEVFCGGGTGYADLGGLVDIAVDPSTGRAIGLREFEIFEFDTKDGTILQQSLVPSVGRPRCKASS